MQNRYPRPLQPGGPASVGRRAWHVFFLDFVHLIFLCIKSTYTQTRPQNMITREFKVWKNYSEPFLISADSNCTSTSWQSYVDFFLNKMLFENSGCWDAFMYLELFKGSSLEV